MIRYGNIPITITMVDKAYNYNNNNNNNNNNSILIIRFKRPIRGKNSTVKGPDL